jgi:protein arginine N-methyltransferase 5
MPIDNSRYEVRQFPIKCDAMLHGFAGYFETVLYKDVMLSINLQHTRLECSVGL